MALDFNDSSTYLSALVNAGADAMSNLYYVEFTGPLLDDGGEFSEQKVALTVRNEEFSGLEFSQGTQSINFMTVSMDVPSSKMTRPHDVSLTFRLDENYNVYKYLLKQQAQTSMPSLGYAGTVIPGEEAQLKNSLTIRVYAAETPIISTMDEEPSDGTEMLSKKKLMYELGHCWIKDISGIDFKNGSDGIIKVKATIGFLDYTIPQSTLLAIDGDNGSTLL